MTCKRYGRMRGLAIMVIALAASCREKEKERDGFVALMNVGAAHLENRAADEAIAAFQEAVAARPKSAAARRNLARAQLLARYHDDALQTLSKVSGNQTDTAATKYLHGLTLIRLSKFEQALPVLQRSVQLDPHTATLRFQLANTLQAVGKADDAAEQLRETIRLDPLHASAHYKLATAARRAGDRETFQRHYEEFEKLREMFDDETRSAEILELCQYTDPEPATSGVDRARPAAIEVEFALGAPAFSSSDSPGPIAGAAVLEVREDGSPIMFVLSRDGAFGVVSADANGCFAYKKRGGQLAETVPSARIFVGDFYDDVPEGETYDPAKHRLQDVLLLAGDRVVLLKQSADGAFRDVTDAAGLADLRATTAAWIDYEHDGDLDLLLGQSSGVMVWQNNGDGTFVAAPETVGVKLDGHVTDIVAVDLDANVAIDFVVARQSEPTIVFENRRTGAFRKMPEPPGPWPKAAAVAAADWNNDGHNDVALAGVNGIEIICGRSGQRDRIELSGVQIVELISMDFDNDGWTDLLTISDAAATGYSQLNLFRNDGSWTNATEVVGLARALPAIAAALPADWDNDGDTDLALITFEGALRLLVNNGGHANGRLAVRLIPTKTNPSGIGTELELRSGAFHAKRLVTGPVIELGLAGHSHADSLRTLWTNGVVDHQIDFELPSSPITITEKVVATGSCPLLYGWDGTRFRFVTDLLGNSPIGLPLTREILLPADPDEIVHVGDEANFVPKDGRYVLQITNEFREILYLDEARLLAVDHAPGVEGHPTDKIMLPPFPTSEVRLLAPGPALRWAAGDDGIDRTAALRSLDGVFGPPGPKLPAPYRGMCHPMALTFDFGPLPNAPLVLALTGWLQYGDGSTNIAMSQDKSLNVFMPKLEVETGTDQWQAVNVTVGMPAGKTKSILVDLTGKLPPGARRLRLSTSFQIRWDRIALMKPVARMPSDGQSRNTSGEESAVHHVALAAAELRWRGFSEIKFRKPGHPTTPDYDVVFPSPPWRTALEGWCTRYGDVLELVAARDNALVIMNAGDALEITFDASSLPPPAKGKKRSFFLFSVGWDKDGDHNVVDGATVAPLPMDDVYRDVPQPADWKQRYNTRWVPEKRF